MAAAIPIVAAVLSVAGGAYMSSEQSRQAEIAQNEAIEAQRAAEARQQQYNKEAAERNQAAYKANAYPTEAEIEAERAAGLKTLGNDRVARLNQLARTSATKGLGSGSGTLGQGSAAIESAYLEGLSGLSSNLSKLANTPKSGFTFPYEANTGAQAGYSSSLASQGMGGYSGTNALGTALGYMAGSGSLNNLFGNNAAANGVPLSEYSPFSAANLGYNYGY